MAGDDVVVAISSINNMAAGISGAINDLQRLQSNVQSMSGSTSPMQSSLSSLGQGFRNVMGHVTSFAGGILNAINPLNLFHSSAMRLLEVMAVWRVFEYGLQKVQDFIGGIWQLPIAMEKAQTSWAYMFNTEPQPGQNLNSWLATGQGNAAQIMNWTKSYSIDIPYTRQDLIQAITTLSASNLSTQGVEKYLPVLADIAAVRSPGTPLSVIAQAVQEGEFGLTRMLRTQLHLMPEQLAQYGYDESNFSTMLPALEAYSQAHGLTNWQNGTDKGAAYQMAHSTFWGEASSFWDRIQNSELATGQYGPFKSLKDGLEWLNNWMDQHSGEMDAWSKLIGGTLSDAMKTAGGAFLAFGKGLQDSGFGNLVQQGFSGLNKFLEDPKTQKAIQDIAKTLGGDLGHGIETLSQDLDKLGGKWSDFIKSFTPEEGHNLANIAGSIGQLVNWLLVLGSGSALETLTTINQEIKKLVSGDIWGALGQEIGGSEGAKFIRWFVQGVQQLPQEFSQLGFIIKFELIQMWDNIIQDVASQFPAWMQTWFQQFKVQFQGWGPKLGPTTAAFVGTWMGQLGTSIQSGLASLTSHFYQAGIDWMNGLVRGLLAGLPNLTKLWTQIEQQMASSFAQMLRNPGGWRVPGIPGV